MAVTGLSELIDPTLALSFADWLDRVEDIALDNGDFEPLGPDHSAILIDGGPLLLVTFENAGDIRDQPTTDVPLGWIMCQGHDWSQLCILSKGESWFRHRAIIEYFDRLIDDGFFDRYDRVVFYGSGPCGYGAASYSVAAPGATLLLSDPHATLDPRLSEWDTRFPQARREDFTSRFGFAPYMAEAAERAFVFYDPHDPLSAMHASLFNADNVARIRCPMLDGQIETFLRRMDLLEGLILMAMRGKLTEAVVFKALRERRSYLPYLRKLLGTVEDRKRPYLAGLLCRSVLTRINTPRFARQLAKAEKRLRKEGRRLPAPHMARSA